jgi:peptidoglycan/LPS O-acetylase OafA/YrhL
MRIAATFDHSNNAFDFLRVVAASAVLYSHSHALLGLPEPRPVAGYTLGTLAVFVFFAISGFLVSQSWDRDPNLQRFALRRALRILPGLIVAVSFTTFVIGPLMTDLPLPTYFLAAETWSYFTSNASLIVGRYTLPGVFKTNPFPNAVNGSLWTLRYEVLVYAVLAAFGMIVRRSRLRFLCLAFLLVLVGGWCLGVGLGLPENSLQLPFLWRIGLHFDWMRIAQLGTFFFGGACLYLFFSHARLSLWAAALLCAGCAMAPNAFYATILLWLAVPYAVLVFAYRAPQFFRRFAKNVDLSYGIYIYAFPVQQVGSYLAVRAGAGWFPTLTMTFIATVLLASLSWHFVERPALAWKARLMPRAPGLRAHGTSKA